MSANDTFGMVGHGDTAQEGLLMSRTFGAKTPPLIPGHWVKMWYHQIIVLLEPLLEVREYREQVTKAYECAEHNFAVLDHLQDPITGAGMSLNADLKRLGDPIPLSSLSALNVDMCELHRTLSLHAIGNNVHNLTVQLHTQIGQRHAFREWISAAIDSLRGAQTFLLGGHAHTQTISTPSIAGLATPPVTPDVFELPPLSRIRSVHQAANAERLRFLRPAKILTQLTPTASTSPTLASAGVDASSPSQAPGSSPAASTDMNIQSSPLRPTLSRRQVIQSTRALAGSGASPTAAAEWAEEEMNRDVQQSRSTASRRRYQRQGPAANSDSALKQLDLVNTSAQSKTTNVQVRARTQNCSGGRIAAGSGALQQVEDSDEAESEEDPMTVNGPAGFREVENYQLLGRARTPSDSASVHTLCPDSQDVDDGSSLPEATLEEGEAPRENDEQAGQNDDRNDQQAQQVHVSNSWRATGFCPDSQDGANDIEVEEGAENLSSIDGRQRRLGISRFVIPDSEDEA